MTRRLVTVKRMADRLGARGATLIEVLVSIVLVSFGLLALTGMQLFSVAANKIALQRGTAVVLASELAEMMRANSAGMLAGNYDRALATYSASYDAVADSGQCSFPNCSTVAKLAANDLNRFRQRVRQALPAGDVAVATTVASQYSELWLVWTEARVFDTSKTSGGTTTNVETHADICPSSITGGASGVRCFYMRVNL